MATGKNTYCVNFEPELRLDLECLREVYFLGTPASNVVRTAVENFIKQNLDSDPVRKRAFEALKEQKLSEATAIAGDKVSFLPKRKRHQGKR